MLDATVVAQGQAAKPEADRIAAERTRRNRVLMLRETGPFVLVAVLLLVALVIYNHRKGYPLTRAHYIGLGMVVLAYVTELLFFLTIMRNYISVSDTDVLMAVTGLE